MTPRKPDHAVAHRALVELLRDLDDEGGRRVPCSGSDRPISEDPDDREFVALAWCPSCPALAACLAAGASEAHGVWGGVDRSKPTRKTYTRKTSTKETNR